MLKNKAKKPMRDGVNNVRTAIKNYDGYVYIPNLREFMEISQKNAAMPAGAEHIPMSSAKIIHGKREKTD